MVYNLNYCLQKPVKYFSTGENNEINCKDISEMMASKVVTLLSINWPGTLGKVISKKAIIYIYYLFVPNVEKSTEVWLHERTVTL